MGQPVVHTKPRAFRLSQEKEGASENVVIEREPDTAVLELEAEAVADAPVRQKRRVPWGSVFLSALGSLLLFAGGLWVQNTVLALFETNPVLGYVGLGLAVLALVALMAVIGRELLGIWREKAIERMRASAVLILQNDDDEAARVLARSLAELYRKRPETAQGRGRIESVDGEIIDAADRLAIVERELLKPLDARAKKAISRAAGQVSVVTAISPRALIDVAFVLYAAAKLVRAIAAIYGGRPGFFGFLRIGRAVLGHLALTGGMAAGDSLVQQVLGHGIAAKLSARLGEGVLNGLLTARVGLAAMAVCRPLPFTPKTTPTLREVAGKLLERKTAS